MNISDRPAQLETRPAPTLGPFLIYEHPVTYLVKVLVLFSDILLD